MAAPAAAASGRCRRAAAGGKWPCGAAWTALLSGEQQLECAFRIVAVLAALRQATGLVLCLPYRAPYCPSTPPSPCPCQGVGHATATPGRGVPPPPSPLARESIGLPFLLDFVSPRGGAAQAAGRRRQMGRYVAYTLRKGCKQVGRCCGVCKLGGGATYEVDVPRCPASRALFFMLCGAPLRLTR